VPTCRAFSEPSATCSLDATHVRWEYVCEMFRGKVAWEGQVEVSAVTGHPRATMACARSFENDAGNQEYVAVLGVPPVNSAQDAVRASIAAENRQR